MEVNTTGLGGTFQLGANDAYVSIVLIELAPLAVLIPVTLKIMYRRDEVFHPVFALMFQEMSVLFLCFVFTFVCVVVRLSLGFSLDRSVVMIACMIVVASFAIMFHQVTWLAITYLRYYILISCPNKDSINMRRLKNRAIAFVWLAVISLSTLFTVFSWLIVMGAEGPTMESMYDYIEIEGNDGPPVYAALFLIILVMNAPDLLSLVVYFRMLRHFNKAVSPIPEPPNLANDEPYAGIWMGGEELSLDNEDSNEEDIVNQLNANNDPQNETKSVMRVLKWHALSSLTDVINVMFFLANSSPALKLIAVLFQMACSFWVPFLVTSLHYMQILKQSLIGLVKCGCT